MITQLTRTAAALAVHSEDRCGWCGACQRWVRTCSSHRFHSGTLDLSDALQRAELYTAEHRRPSYGGSASGRRSSQDLRVRRMFEIALERFGPGATTPSAKRDAVCELSPGCDNALSTEPASKACASTCL
jgi:hypothetical protein